MMNLCEDIEEEFTEVLPVDSAPVRPVLLVNPLSDPIPKVLTQLAVWEEEDEPTVSIPLEPQARHSQFYQFLFDPYFPPPIALGWKKFWGELRRRNRECREFDLAHFPDSPEQRVRLWIERVIKRAKENLAQ